MREFNPDKLHGRAKELWNSINDEWKNRLSTFFDEILKFDHDNLGIVSEDYNDLVWVVLLTLGVSKPGDNKYRK